MSFYDNNNKGKVNTEGDMRGFFFNLFSLSLIKQTQIIHKYKYV